MFYFLQPVSIIISYNKIGFFCAKSQINRVMFGPILTFLWNACIIFVCYKEEM